MTGRSSLTGPEGELPGPDATRSPGQTAGRRLSPSAVKARATDARERLEAQRPTNRAIDTAFGAAQLQNESGGGLLAGAIAFRFFLFIVPFVFVLVMGIGLGTDAAGGDIQEVARRSGITGVAAVALQSGATASTVVRWTTFVVSLVALLAGARNFTRALWVANALLWKVPLRKLAHPMRAGLAFIGIFVGATLLLRLTYALRTVSFLGFLVSIPLYAVLLAAVWLVCSARFPRPAGVTWRDMVPGAVLFGVGAQALQVVTTLWIAPSTESKSQTYGAIGAALTILLWAYILGQLVTASAALNATLWRSRPDGPGDGKAPIGDLG
jgi:uncharacterized BrkB/YihY/UPF0761 family membrane protein